MGELAISFEMFPPKTPEMEKRLWDSVERLSALDPAFISVTYGAGGSTRERTHDVVERIAKAGRVKSAGHITCVGATRAEVDDVLKRYWAAGVTSIVALRGDPPEGVGAAYTPHDGGYAYASDLIVGAREIAPFDISVGCYPECHPEAKDLAHELETLKRKFDAGADRAITQFFFEPDVFLRFVDAARNAGIDKPIVPGIMLQSNFAGIARMAKLCGTKIPTRIIDLYDGLENDPQTRELVTAQLVAELCNELRDKGVSHFHFYTMNRANLSLSTCRLLGLNPKKEVA
ncbi:methylenetetrahydrofolate reductase [NAD(P)H] [Hyphococcus formosus]|uniref:methylenetetrahydrofolate reductase [NAD(P)H] n=1 Tax=Hyphococcus formosus TaxID=3143534 RepID=UPI00398AB199